MNNRKILYISKYEIARLREIYKELKPIEITRLAQIYNLDNINWTSKLRKILENVRKLSYGAWEREEFQSYMIYNTRAVFIRDYFMI